MQIYRQIPRFVNYLHTTYKHLSNRMEHAVLLSQLFEQAFIREMGRKAGYLKLPAGERLSGLGSYTPYVPFVLTGTMLVSILTKEGKYLPLYPITTYQTCALCLLYGIKDSSGDIQLIASEDTSLLAIPFVLIADWCARFPSFKQFVRQTLLFAPPKAQVWSRRAGASAYGITYLGNWVGSPAEDSFCR
jgi:hypothetical protein